MMYALPPCVSCARDYSRERGQERMSKSMTLQVYFNLKWKKKKRAPSTTECCAVCAAHRRKARKEKTNILQWEGQRETLPWCQHHSDCYFWFHSTCPLKKNACGWSDPFHFWLWFHCVRLWCEWNCFYDSAMLPRHLQICWIHAWHSCRNDSSY